MSKKAPRRPAFGGYFKFVDVKDNPVDLTISKIDEEEVGQDKEEKYVVRFEEDPRGVVMGPAKYDQLVEALDTEDLDEMEGKVIRVAGDPNVKFGNKRVGGVVFEAV